MSATERRRAPTNEEIEEARPEDDERLYTGEPLETEEGEVDQPAQQPVGRERLRGGGEWPDPHAPAQAPAPGAVDEVPPSPGDEEHEEDRAGEG